MGGAGVLALSGATISAVEASAGESRWTNRIGIVGTVTTVAGLLVALRQLARTATAAEASRTAAREAERRTTAALTLSLVDHLLAFDNEMDVALAGSREEVLRVIRQWRQIAGEIQRLLATLGPQERDFARNLHLSIALARACSHAIADPTASIPESLGGFRTVVGFICDDVPELKARLARSGGAVA